LRFSSFDFESPGAVDIQDKAISSQIVRKSGLRSSVFEINHFDLNVNTPWYRVHPRTKIRKQKPRITRIGAN